MAKGKKQEVKLESFNSETEALMVADLLKGEGIPSVLVPLGAGQGAFGASVWRPFELRVRSTDLAHAKAVLAEYLSAGQAESKQKQNEEEAGEDGGE